jgi:hypothetical protein
MVYLILSFLLTISSISLAQTRTGSGGVVEDSKDTVLPPSEDSLSGMKSGSLEEKLSFVTKEFEIQDKKCRTDGHRFLELKQNDFMQLYLKLSVLKSSFIAEDKCQDISVYFQCLYSPQLKANLLSILQDKSVRKHIQKKYNLKKEEAREVIKFFKDLDKSCESNGCKM